MTFAEKLTLVKNILRVDDPATITLLNTYLTAAEKEIIGWRYSYAGNAPETVPPEYEMTQVQAVINGFTQSGNEGQSVSIENGIHRHFAYSDMIRYIRANVIPIAKVPGAVSTDAAE